jgi:uncharacterized membrane protein
MESHRRSIVKALSWRVVALLITTLVAGTITGSLRFAAIIGGTDTAIKLAAYYFHERLWNRLSYGRVPGPEYQI